MVIYIPTCDKITWNKHTYRSTGKTDEIQVRSIHCINVIFWLGYSGIVMQDASMRGNWVKGMSSLFYFSQLHENLQLSQNKKLKKMKKKMHFKVSF